LAAPGKLVAYGSPVALKRDLGKGYSVQVSFEQQVHGMEGVYSHKNELLLSIRAIVPQTHVSVSSPQLISYHLGTRDAIIVGNVLQLLDKEKATYGVTSYDVLGTSIEDIFLELMAKEEGAEDVHTSQDTIASEKTEEAAEMALASGRPMSPLQQALTIFYKRCLIVRRSWLMPVLAIVVAIAGSTVPLVFLRGTRQTCVRTFQDSITLPLYLPSSPIVPPIFDSSSRVLTSPPGIASILGNSTASFGINNISDNSTFVDTITQDYRNLMLGGVSIDLATRASLIAWEATPPGYTGPSMLNLATNILFNSALNSSGNDAGLILANYSPFPEIGAGTLISLRWITFFFAAMVRLPAFLLLFRSFTLHSPCSQHSMHSMYPGSDTHLYKQCKCQMVLGILSVCG
jgi:ATP-binding cassette subfamily A (ABC1) protein 3